MTELTLKIVKYIGFSLNAYAAVFCLEQYLLMLGQQRWGLAIVTASGVVANVWSCLVHLEVAQPPRRH